MNDICKITALILFLLSLSFGQTKKEKEIIKFLNARYNASLDSVGNYLDQNFIYYHIYIFQFLLIRNLIFTVVPFFDDSISISPS